MLVPVHVKKLGCQPFFKLEKVSIELTILVLLQEDGRKAVLGLFGEEREVNKVTGRLKVVS